jgi:hypothetical protein
MLRKAGKALPTGNLMVVSGKLSSNSGSFKKQYDENIYKNG